MSASGLAPLRPRLTNAIEWATMANAKGQAINELEELAEARAQLDAWISEAVTRAHTEHSYAIIGEALGVTRQAAQQRYGPKRPWVCTAGHSTDICNCTN